MRKDSYGNNQRAKGKTELGEHMTLCSWQPFFSYLLFLSRSCPRVLTAKSQRHQGSSLCEGADTLNFGVCSPVQTVTVTIPWN